MRVSICSITYNHEKYISEAIESWLKQQTNFDFEIVIGEDCSSDNTKSIINNYREKYSGKISLISSDENIGMIPNFMRTLDACQGEYIAFCEGDDYWIDPYKLQKQVDFMEKNPEYSMCVHNAIVDFEDDENKTHFFNEATQKSILTTIDLIDKWSFATGSMLFRAKHLPRMERDLSSKIHNGDLYLALMVSLGGPIKYIPNVMSVYRRSNYAIRNKSFRQPGKNYNPHYIIDKRIELLKIFDNLSNGIYTGQINDKINKLRKVRRTADLYYRFPIMKYLRPKKICQILARRLCNHN
jgi:glycosyltransferase involved in cell wall biosynthesis